MWISSRGLLTFVRGMLWLAGISGWNGLARAGTGDPSTKTMNIPELGLTITIPQTWRGTWYGDGDGYGEYGCADDQDRMGMIIGVLKKEDADKYNYKAFTEKTSPSFGLPNWGRLAPDWSKATATTADNNGISGWKMTGGTMDRISLDTAPGPNSATLSVVKSPSNRHPIVILTIVNDSTPLAARKELAAALASIVPLNVFKGSLEEEASGKTLELRCASGKIRVVAAKYGGNCSMDPLKTTDSRLATECNGKSACTYKVSHTAIGDPAPRCAKDYVAFYDCPTATR